MFRRSNVFSPYFQCHNKYKCNDCEKSYSFEIDLKWHTNRKICQLKSGNLPKPRGNEKCPHCPKYFSFKRSLERHIRGIHLGKSKCDLCKKVFASDRVLKIHLLGATTCKVKSGEVPAECIIDKFSTTDTNKPYHRLKTTVYKCRYCEDTFSTRKLWNNHEQNIHDREGLIYQKKLKYMQKHRCFICNEPWEDRSSLNVHLRRNHNYDRFTGRVFKSSRKIENNCLRCDHCSQTFTLTSKRALLNHLTNAHFPRLLVPKCQICFRKFKSHEYLQRHIARLHSDSKSLIECKICLQPFKFKSYYKLHFKRNHLLNQ